MEIYKLRYDGEEFSDGEPGDVVKSATKRHAHVAAGAGVKASKGRKKGNE